MQEPLKSAVVLWWIRVHLGFRNESGRAGLAKHSHFAHFAASPKKLRVAACAFLIGFSLQLVGQSNAPATDFSLALERTPCLGPCPWYSVTILGNGSVHYEGKSYVHVEGIHEKTIPVSEVNKLIQNLRDEDFFHWEEKTDLCVDYPEVKITANLNGQHKQVLEGCSAPGKVLELAKEIDTISGTKNWVGNVREELIQKKRGAQLSTQETVPERCHVARDPFDNQPMPEQFKIPNAPKTARHVSCFVAFKKDSTMLDVVKKCGIPDQHAGSAYYIFIYYMDDCSTVTVGTPDLKRLGIRHVKQKRTTVLFNNW
jgi:Domain of unknown function (DUF6438)